MATPAANSAGNNEAPFWQQLPGVLLYPLQGPAWLATLALALFSVLAALPGLVGLILLAVTWLAIYTYGFEILRRSANGNRRAPEQIGELFDGAAMRLIALMVVCVAMVIAAGLLGPLVMLAVSALLFVLHPVWLMSLALDGSLRQALRPDTAINTVRLIAGPYAVALVLVFGLQIATALVWALCHAKLPGVLAWPLATAVQTWALFASFRLFGLLVYCHRDQLGFEADSDDNTPLPSAAERAEQALLQRVDALLEEQRTASACQLLEQAVGSGQAGPAVYALLARLLTDAPLAQQQQHAGNWLHYLLHDNQPRQALTLWREQLQRDPGFTPTTAALGQQLVNAALNGNQRQLAHDGLRSLIARWPGHELVPEWALQLALLAADLHADADNARRWIAQGLAASNTPEQQRRLHAALQMLPSTL